MDLVLIIIGIAIISIVISYVSLINEKKKGKHVEEVKKELKRERVIYYSSSKSS